MAGRRIRVEHRRLGTLYGDLLWRGGGRCEISLDAFPTPANVGAQYVSDAEGDVQDERPHTYHRDAI